MNLRRICVLIGIGIIASLSGFQLYQSTPATASIQLRPCELPGVKAKARCGTLEVFENRATQEGRKININVLVVPATGPKRLPDPLFYFAGGPGSSAVEDAQWLANELLKINEQRDLVFVDQRGTGGSNPLNCTLFDPNHPRSYFEYFFPLEAVKKCREELTTKADLTLYTTSIAMDDIDDVRAALGYERVNTFGISYGTRAALVYLKQHEKHVRTTILHGACPTNDFLPRDYPLRNERALQGVLAECAADEACNKKFPKVREDAKAALARLLQGPVNVELPSTDAKGANNYDVVVKIQLSRDLAAEAIRYMLYNPVAAARVPFVLNQAAKGNFGPIAQAALNYRQQIVATGSNGMYLSVTCAEDLPWIKEGDGERLAENTFLGDYRLRQQREACALWPRGDIPADYARPVESKVPVLLLTGEWDPVTPPSNGETVAKSLPNGRHVIVPHGAHAFFGLDGLECIDKLINDFIEQGSTKNLNTDCVSSIKRKGFVLE
jgi:pimeloyl-ACP methyl ester carboxylesterase